MNPTIITRWLTCHSSGCTNSEVPIRMRYPEDVGVLICGVCSQPITDVAEGPPEEVTEMPTWEL